MCKTKVNLFTVIFVSVSLFLMAGSPVRGQQANQRWVCLKYQRCGDLKDEPKCIFTNDNGIVENRFYHSARITTKEGDSTKLEPNSKTYIVEVLQVPDWLVVPEAIKAKYEKIPTEIRTTGNSEVDKLLFSGNDNFALAHEIFSGYNGGNGYQFDGYYAQDLQTKIEPENANHYFMSDANGKFVKDNFIYTSHTWTYPNVIERKLLAVNFIEGAGGAYVGELGAQQQATFTFESVYNDKDCVKISWDPYGRIFDGTTLEPLPNATVWLMRKNADGTYVAAGPSDSASGVLPNPVTTLEDGKFSFLTMDGTYQIRPVLPTYHSNTTGLDYQYVIPGAAEKLNGNNFYVNVNRGEDIVEKGAAIEANVQADPAADSYPTVPRIMGSFVKPDSTNNAIITIDGTVSHPFAIVNAYCVDAANTAVRKTYLVSNQADKNGNFYLSIDQSQCPEGEVWGVLEPSKTELGSGVPQAKNGKSNLVSRFMARLASLLFPEASARAATVTVKGIPRLYEPIPTYLEGYAYDANGRTLANATIGLYEYGALKPAYTVQADAKGLFKVESENVPQWSYRIQYSAPGGQIVKTTTSKFIAQNVTYIAQHKVNPFVAKDSTNRPVTVSPTGAKQGTGAAASGASSVSSAVSRTGGAGNVSRSTGSGGSRSSTASTVRTTRTPMNPMILVFALLIILLAGVGAGIILYMKNRQASMSSW